MKNRKENIRKTLFFIGILLTMILLCSTCFASAGEINVDDITITESEIEELKPVLENILGFVQVLGSAISVIVIVVIGIKYMWSSAEEKFEIKQTMIYYLIGAILLFTTVNIVTIIYNIFW